MFENLLTQPSTPQVSPELLETLGRSASRMFLQQKVPLNDAVRQLVAEHPGLGDEHLRRIVEFANNTTFQEMFQGGTDKNVHFPVADPGVIVRDVKDGGSPAHDGKTMGSKKDFSSPPVAPGGGEGDAALSELFGESSSSTNSAPMSMGKNASEQAMEVPHAEHANPVENVYDHHLQVQGTRDQLARENDINQVELSNAKDDFYGAVKSEVLAPNGAGLGGVVGALQKVASNERLCAVMPSVVNRLCEDGVSPQALEASMNKTAGAVVNPEHTLIKSWYALEKAAAARVQLETAMADADAALAETHRFLRSA
jgi:hypothetical protein